MILLQYWPLMLIVYSPVFLFFLSMAWNAVIGRSKTGIKLYERNKKVAVQIWIAINVRPVSG